MAERLDTPRIALHDGAAAELLTFGSAVTSLLPERANFIGKADTPSYTPVRWHHLRKPAESVGGQWVSYEGIGSAGNTPRNYAAAAIILVDRETMDAALRGHDEDNMHPAVAYKLGTAVMVGASSKYKILGLEHEDDPDYKVAMRIGKGPLDAQVAIETQYVGKRRLYLPLEEGVRAGPVMPIAEVPDTVPLV